MASVAPLMEKVFRTVEIGLLGELVTEDITEGMPPTPAAAAPPAATGPTPGGAFPSSIAQFYYAILDNNTH